MEWDKKLEYLFIYHFFGLLWTNQFIVGFGYASKQALITTLSLCLLSLLMSSLSILLKRMLLLLLTLSSCDAVQHSSSSCIA